VAATQGDSPESAAALETICRAYWPPLYAYARRCGHPPADAQDLTQEFFARLLEKRWLETADREKGRLRSLLVVALKNFMSKEWRRASALKRGGNALHLPMDTALAERCYETAAPAAFEPDELFDRQWALTLLNLTLQRLQNEFAAARKTAEFETLKVCLMAGHEAIDYAAMAQRLGCNAGAARVAVHRLRKRFRELSREEVSRTLAEGADVEEELRHLAATLAREVV